MLITREILFLGLNSCEYVGIVQVQQWLLFWAFEIPAAALQDS